VLKLTVGVAILLVVALVGHRQTFTRLRLPAGARIIFLTGTEFILVGVALGDELIGLLDEATIRGLTPLFSLGLGAVGLIFGIGLDLRNILRFPLRYSGLTVIQSAFTMAVVFLPFWWVLSQLFGGAESGALLAALVLAASAGCTAQTSLAMIDHEFELRGGRVMGLLRYVSSLDAVVGLFALGLAFCLVHDEPVLGVAVLPGLQWYFLSLSLGTAMGFLLDGLTRMRCSEEELMVFVIGTVLFSSGIALYFKLSPLFINAIMGMLIANLPGSKDRIFGLLVRLERPFYIVFLILAGAIWRPGSAWALPLAALYLVLRFAGKLGGGFLAARSSDDAQPLPDGLGLGLMSQGGMAVAMVMNYYPLGSGAMTDVVVTIVLVGVILNELVGPSLAMRLLRRTGEIPA
jgi:hypothetical protein